MKIRLLLCAVPVIFCAQLHAQTGIYVNSSNNVGIGTTSPIYPLDVSGVIRSTVVGGSNLYLSKANGSSIAFDNGSGSTKALIEANNGPGLEFWTNTATNTGIVERMFIDNSGNVGIGTTSPDKTLVVSNTLSGSASTVSVLTRFVNNGYGNTVMLDLTDAHSSDGVITFTANNSAANALLGFGVNAAQKMVIDGNGNVGIGTTSPATALSIGSPAGADKIITLSSGSNAYQNRSIFTNANGLNFGFSNSNGDPTQVFATMTLQGGGNVGIGTTSPQYKLDVAGQVHASSFVSSTQTYADFVFKPGYKLESLSDVEASIKKDGHLPGIPSEDEAKAHGIDLASMQVKLLQKIEELTLHVINQEKRIEQLEKENAGLRAQH